MPHKFNSSRRHRFDTKRYRVTNWPEYNEGFRQRGDVTVWLREDVVQIGATPQAASRYIQTFPFAFALH